MRAHGLTVVVIALVVWLLVRCGGPGKVELSGLTCGELEQAGVLNMALYDCDEDGRVYRVDWRER